MMKKILFFDLDGTLWNHEEVIPESAAEAIRLARANGHEVWINTGRSRAFVYQPQLFALGLDGAVTGAGTMIECRREGQSALSLCWRENRLAQYDEVPADMADATVARLRAHRFHTILEGRDHLYCDVEEFGDDPFVKRVKRKMGDNLLPITGNEGRWSFVKVSCDLRDATGREDALEWFGKHFEVFDHNGIVMEFAPKGHTKGSGLIAACQARGIPVEDSIVFGDGRNDLEMFDAAGIAVAMGNGTAIAREHATFVTKPYDQDGIFEAMKSLGLI